MGLHKPIAHLAAGIHQDFIVVDNICGDWDFEDGGNPVVMNRVMAAVDPVLCDAYVAHLMGYELEEIPYIQMAAELGAGLEDWELVQLRELNFPKEKAILPKERKIVELQDAVKEEGTLKELKEKICIGQGFRGKTGELGIGQCTRKFRHFLKGCPPTEEEIYEFLKNYIGKK